MVDLRGQLSNPSAQSEFNLVEVLLSRSEPCGEACNPALRGERHVRIRDKVDVDQLVGHFADGATIKELAASYGISESSVKRLLRACGARRL
jgi:hypothetical protein